MNDGETVIDCLNRMAEEIADLRRDVETGNAKIALLIDAIEAHGLIGLKAKRRVLDRRVDG